MAKGWPEAEASRKTLGVTRWETNNEQEKEDIFIKKRINEMSSQSNEEFLCGKMRSNWRIMIDTLVNKHTVIVDILFEVAIITIGDSQQVEAIPADLDKIDFLLRKVLYCNKCETFFDILGRNGFESLCKQIIGSDLEWYSGMKTYSKQESSLKRDKELDELEAMVRSFEALDKEQEENSEKQLEDHEENWGKRFEEWGEKLLKRDKEREEQYITQFRTLDEKQIEIESQNESYAHLHESVDETLQYERYRNLLKSCKSEKGRMNEMGKAAKQIQSEIINLEKEFKKRDRINLKIIQEHKILLANKKRENKSLEDCMQIMKEHIGMKEKEIAEL